MAWAHYSRKPQRSIVVGPAAGYIVTASSYGPSPGAVVTITAQLVDANNHSVKTAGLVVTWSKSDPGGSFGAATSTTDANGIATVTFTTSATAETAATVTGTDGSSRTGTSATITTHLVPTHYIVTPATTSPNTSAIDTISAQLVDASNNPVGIAGRVVTWSKSHPDGSFSVATSTTNSSGIATVDLTVSNTAGVACTVTATDTGSLTGTSATITTGLAGVPWRTLRVYDSSAGVPQSPSDAAVGVLLLEIALTGTEFGAAVGGYRPLNTTLSGTTQGLGAPGYMRVLDGAGTTHEDIPLVLPDDTVSSTQEVRVNDPADEATPLGQVVHHMGQWFPGITVQLNPNDLQLVA